MNLVIMLVLPTPWSPRKTILYLDKACTLGCAELLELLLAAAASAILCPFLAYTNVETLNDQTEVIAAFLATKKLCG